MKNTSHNRAEQRERGRGRREGEGEIFNVFSSPPPLSFTANSTVGDGGFAYLRESLWWVGLVTSKSQNPLFHRTQRERETL
jgi:hypothetical protein